MAPSMLIQCTFCQHTHTHTQLWTWKKAYDNTNPKNHKRDIQEKPLWLYKKREPLFWENHNLFSLFHLLHCIDWYIANPSLTHRHWPCEWEKLEKSHWNPISIGDFPLVLQWRFSSKLNEGKTQWRWLLTRAWKAQVHKEK